MILDFHTHTFPDELAPRALDQLRQLMPPGTSPFTDGTGRGLLESMDAAGIEVSVTLPVATKESQVDAINAAAAQCSLDTRIIRFGSLFPDSPAIERHIGFLREHRVPGIKLHPEYQQFDIADPRYFPMYEQLGDAGLLVVFHAGWDPAPFCRDRASPQALREIADRFASLRIVAAHMGGHHRWDDVQRYLCGSRVFFDTSAEISQLDAREFGRRVRAHGADRVLFGSDSPWFSQQHAIAQLEQSGLSDGELEQIRWGNAARLLQLPSRYFPRSSQS
jgi:uncharacterized protein